VQGQGWRKEEKGKEQDRENGDNNALQLMQHESSLSSFGREQEDKVLKPKLGTFKRFHREGKEGESKARESEHKEVREKRKYQTEG
jgi:hypothetical protein